MNNKKIKLYLQKKKKKKKPNKGNGAFVFLFFNINKITNMTFGSKNLSHWIRGISVFLS